MAGSVWLEEVDRALLGLIPTVVKYFDEEGEIQEVDTFVRNPEGEYKVESYPSVTIFNYNQIFASYRYDHEEQVVDIIDGVAVIEKPALPYDLFYQIDFWSEYQEDINEMTRRWAGNVEERGVLEVVDTEGNTRYSVMELIDYANIDHIDGDERIFHRAYSYRIWVELDERTATNKKVVLEAEIRRSENVQDNELDE